MGSKVDNMLALQVTHEWAEVEDLEAARLGESCSACSQIMGLDGIEECIVVQTCNRVEIYTVVSDLQEGEEALRGYARKNMDLDVRDYMELLTGEELLEHLLRLACGMESMVFGEDQILGQIEKEYETARDEGTVGHVLGKGFEKAIRVGKLVRTETGINSGATSVGAAAVRLAEELFGTLEDKGILIIGAGETAELVGRSLMGKNPSSLTVANRTYEKGLNLADELGGNAIKFSNFPELLPDLDVVISATGAPHVILEKEDLEGRIPSNKDLLIIDVANPRDICKSVSEIENVKLCDLDSLRRITDRNLERRKEEANKAGSIIKKELLKLVREYKKLEGDKLVGEIHKEAEKIRKREVERAMGRLKKCSNELDGGEMEVLEDLTRGLIRKTLHEPVSQIRKASKKEDKVMLEVAERLFKPPETDKK